MMPMPTWVGKVRWNKKKIFRNFIERNGIIYIRNSLQLSKLGLEILA